MMMTTRRKIMRWRIWMKQIVENDDRIRPEKQETKNVLDI
jgi:hypothetical protein